MSRKQTVATVMLAIVGAGGLSYASDGGSPFVKLAEALEEVDGNTIAIAGQTSMIAKETTAVVQQNAAIANQTAALAKASTQLDQKLDAVLNAIGKIEMTPPPPPAAPSSPAHAVWLAPYVFDIATESYSSRAVAYVLNAGAVPATYTCNYFNQAGTPLVAHQTHFTIAPGRIGTCEPVMVLADVGVGWLLIVSDNPVIATGKNSRLSGGTFTTSENMSFRPIDCSGDQLGIEHVCVEVETIQKGK